MERMLRMKKDNSEYEIDQELTGKFAIEKNVEYQDRIAELEEENKKLNKHLGEKIDRIQVLIREKYEEKGEKLELFKENKNLKEKIELLDNENMCLNAEIKDREEENKKLKSDLGECECSFGFENDEVGFWKREYKRLKKWIKDHCKGYGNLFPEDEMKRQWKKTDKKRKNKLKGILMEEDTLQELRDIGEL